MFFFTEQDPNFRIKGSRDPLGFQPIWQSLGRTVVKHLSTVSNNIKDFQVLSYAWYFYGDKDPKNFMTFFLKFEQACGFARGHFLPDDRFNGIDYIRKNLNKDSYAFSTKNEHTLLSNQKSYGIYGKYNRPFNDMRIKEQDNFREIMEESLREKVDFALLNHYIDRLKTEKVSVFQREELILFSDCLATLSNSEKDFYREVILKEQNCHVQNDIFSLFEEHPELIAPNGFELYGFIDAVTTKNISEPLKEKLIKIKHAEQVLSPYVYLFRTLQTTPIWTKNSVDEAPIFSSFPKKLPYEFDHSVIDSLNHSFTESPYEMVRTAIKRNSAVSEGRNNATWIKEENDQIVVCYADGARNINQFDNNYHFEHNYFLPTYISLYKQIMHSND